MAGLEHEIPAARGLIGIRDDPALVARLAAGSFFAGAGADACDLPLRELAAVLVGDWAQLGLTSPAPAHRDAGC